LGKKTKIPWAWGALSKTGERDGGVPHRTAELALQKRKTTGKNRKKDQGGQVHQIREKREKKAGSHQIQSSYFDWDGRGHR